MHCESPHNAVPSNHGAVETAKLSFLVSRNARIVDSWMRFVAPVKAIQVFVEFFHTGCTLFAHMPFVINVTHCIVGPPV